MQASSRGEMIPEDVVFQILAWLPVASVLRFKLVCKAWLSHLDSSGFISQHTRRVSNSEDNKLVVMNMDFRRNIYCSVNFISVNDLQLFKYIEFQPSDELHVTGQLPNASLVASLDGIFCLEHTEFGVEGDEDYVVSLWNPATTQFTVLPPGQIDFKSTRDVPYVAYHCGIGFDVKFNDYKVVRVASKHSAFDMDLFKSQAEVYSLRMGSWKIIDAVLPLNFIITDNPNQPFQEEIYCWSGYDQRSRCHLILSFDFSKEVFGIIPVPEVCSPPETASKLILAFLRGKIACINLIYDYPEHRLDHCKIWVLDKYGVKESWTNPYKLMLDENDNLEGFSMDGRIILIRGYGDQKLCLYDPLTQEVNEVPTQGTISEAAVYKESLISVKSATDVLQRE